MGGQQALQPLHSLGGPGQVGDRRLLQLSEAGATALATAVPPAMRAMPTCPGRLTPAERGQLQQILRRPAGDERP
jgi:hypothetical protein